MAYLRLVSSIEHAQSQGEAFEQSLLQMQVLHDFAYDLIDVKQPAERVSQILGRIEKVDPVKLQELVDKITLECQSQGVQHETSSNNTPFSVVADPDKLGSEEVKTDDSDSRKSNAWLGSFFGQSFPDMSKLQTPRDSVVKLGNRLESALGGLGSGLDARVDALTRGESVQKFTESINYGIGSFASYVAPKSTNVAKNDIQNLIGHVVKTDDFVEFEDPNDGIPEIEQMTVNDEPKIGLKPKMDQAIESPVKAFDSKEPGRL